jgi:Ca-activated chloride channel family protein
MNQLYGDQEKYVLIEIDVPKTDADKKIDIASADISYTNTITGKQERSSATGNAVFSKNHDAIKRSENLSVIKEYQLNLNALSEEKAIALSDKGKKQEAIETLKASASRLKAYSETYNDQEVQQEAEAVMEQADMIEKEGMSKKSRKLLRTKSFQKKNQQY